ncbi:MAG TPA: class I SAM-dependent methyltransferase [Acidimicrobiales bacterium]|nr:class I SAM-dependent methyltransferase [Acidimicrobiales bacterium]
MSREQGPTGLGFDARYFELLLRAEDEHFWFAARNHVIATAVRQVVQGRQPGYRVLEVGCGTGNVLRTLEAVCKRGTVVGTEPFAEGAQLARSRVTCPVLVGDVSQLSSLFEEPFDVIGSFDVIEHIEDDVRALEQLRTLLSPDGRLVMTVPASPRLWSAFDVASHHQRRYTRRSLRDTCQDAGYLVEWTTYFMMPLVPAAWTKRVLTGQSSGDDDLAVIETEFKIVPVLNGLAKQVLRLESAYFACGGRLPFGTSLLAVARARH